MTDLLYTKAANRRRIIALETSLHALTMEIEAEKDRNAKERDQIKDLMRSARGYLNRAVRASKDDELKNDLMNAIQALGSNPSPEKIKAVIGSNPGIQSLLAEKGVSLLKEAL